MMSKKLTSVLTAQMPKKQSLSGAVPLICICLLAFGFFLRLYYVYLTPYNVSAHDLGYAVGLHTENKIGSGHLGYIEHIARTGWVPDFDPSTRWAFYNPPFFHLCVAVLLSVLHSPEAGIDTEAWEMVQCLPAVCIFLATLGIFLILRELRIDGVPLVLGVLLVSAHPSLSYLSLTLNNDAMAFAFTVWAVYFALRWFSSPSMGTILALGACIGLGMMTKLSVALIAPPVAVLFAVRFFSDKKWWNHIGQFSAFLGVCAPLGLWWGIRNLVRFDLPITYVQALPEGSAQNISGYTLWERFGIPPFSEFLRVNGSWSRPKPDHNLWVQTLRTSLFDDNMLVWGGADLGQASILMVLALLLSIFLGILFFWGMLRAREYNIWIRVFFVSLGVLLFGYFVKFCFDFPMTCTIHFRYLLPLLLLAAVGVGVWWNSTKKGRGVRMILSVFAGMLLIFCIISALLYTWYLPVAA